MTERKPIQISGDMVLCEDNTIWKYDGAWWVKLAPIPTDEEIPRTNLSLCEVRND